MNQCIAIRLKYAHSSVDIGNHRYNNVQNCIILKYKCDKKEIFAPPPPPPHPKNVYCCAYFRLEVLVQISRHGYREGLVVVKLWRVAARDDGGVMVREIKELVHTIRCWLNPCK